MEFIFIKQGGVFSERKIISLTDEEIVKYQRYYAGDTKNNIQKYKWNFWMYIKCNTKEGETKR